MNQDQTHFVIVDFQVQPSAQRDALADIGRYVDEFLSTQPGFLRSRLHAGLDGTSIVHYAQWRSAQDFQRAAEKAQHHPDLPRMRSYNPNGRGFTEYATYGDHQP